MAKFLTLQDNFNDNSIDGSKWGSWADAGTSIAETNQQLEATVPDNDTGSAGIYSDTTYDLTSSACFAEVTQVVDTGSWHDTILYVKKDSSNFLRTVCEEGTLYFQYYVGGGGTTAASVAYNASTHKWWKIREASGTIYWDTSSDGTSWTNRASVSNPFVITAMEVDLYAEAWDSIAGVDPRDARFDNFNVRGPMGVKTINDTNLFSDIKTINDTALASIDTLMDAS